MTSHGVKTSQHRARSGWEAVATRAWRTCEAGKVARRTRLSLATQWCKSMWVRKKQNEKSMNSRNRCTIQMHGNDGLCLPPTNRGKQGCIATSSSGSQRWNGEMETRSKTNQAKQKHAKEGTHKDARGTPTIKLQRQGAPTPSTTCHEEEDPQRPSPT